MTCASQALNSKIEPRLGISRNGAASNNKTDYIKDQHTGITTSPTDFGKIHLVLDFIKKLKKLFDYTSLSAQRSTRTRHKLKVGSDMMTMFVSLNERTRCINAWGNCYYF